MLVNTFQTRGIRFAYLFGPPRFIGRDEATAVYSAVSDALHLDDMTFSYSAPEAVRPSSRAFSVELARQEGRGGLGLKIDNPSLPNPMRMLLSYEWPPSLQHVEEQFDSMVTAVFQALEGEWQRVMAEVRIRAQCTASGNDALRFIRERLLAVSPQSLDGLGQPLRQVSVRFEIDPSAPEGGDPLSNPGRQLTIETLREDARSVYLECVSRWPQLPVPADARGEIRIDPTSIRPIEANPSEYVNAAIEYARQTAAGLSETTNDAGDRN